MRTPCGYSSTAATRAAWRCWRRTRRGRSGQAGYPHFRAKQHELGKRIYPVCYNPKHDQRLSKDVAQLAERYPWVTLIAIPVAGILAAILIATLQDYQAKQAERVRVNTEINRIIQTAADFDPIVHRYITLARAGDPQANGYHDRILNDPSVSRMNDVIAKPVTQWPSIDPATPLGHTTGRPSIYWCFPSISAPS